MKRREFLSMSLAGLLASWASRRAKAQSSGDRDDRLQRVCVSSWSFHTHFERQPDNPSATLMDVLDFPEMVADRYHVHSVEIVSPHFRDADPTLVRAFKARLVKAHSRLVNVPLDFDVLWEKPAISSTDPVERRTAISMYTKGMDIARDLGSPSVRCDPGKVNIDDPSLTVDSYKQLAAHARTMGLQVLVENHGDISRHPEVLVTILKAANVRALPDMGNFPDQDTRERGLRLMYPIAGGVSHAKMNQGLDFSRCMQIAKEAGYTGVFSIEAGGRGDSYEAVQRVVDALLQNL